MTPGAARALWLSLSAAGTAIAFVASMRHGLIAAVAVLTFWAYAARLKRVAGLGHVFVGGALAAAVVYGALVMEQEISRPVFAAAALALLLVTVREVVKAIPDIDGDRAFGASTLPTVLGPRGAARLAAGAIGVTTAALPLLATAGYDSMVLAYTLPMAGLLVASFWVLLSTDALRRAGQARWAACATRASALLKVALGAGVGALALAR